MTKTLIQSLILPEGISDGITLPLAPTECSRTETCEVLPRRAGKAISRMKGGKSRQQEVTTSGQAAAR